MRMKRVISLMVYVIHPAGEEEMMPRWIVIQEMEKT